MKKFTFLCTASALGAMMLVAPATALAAENMKIVLNSQANEGGYALWLAQRLGYYEKNGLDVKIQYFANGGAALASGASGGWQAGWTGAPPAITGWTKFGLITVGTMMKEDKNIKLLMRTDALKDSSPAKVLTSKRIGVVPNSTWSQVLYACAAHFHVDPQKMKIVPLEPAVTRQSLRSGQVGAGMTDSGADYSLVNDKKDFKNVCDGAVAGTSVIDPYIVTAKFAKEHPSAAAHFVNAVYQANEFIGTHPKEAVTHMLEYYKAVGIKGGEARAHYTLGLRDFLTLDQALSDMKDGSTTKALEGTAQVFVASGTYDKMPDLASDIKAGLPILEAAEALRK